MLNSYYWEKFLPSSPLGFPGGSDGKESACNAGDPGLILGSGRCPGEGNGNPLQHSYLENSMDRGGWRATVHGVAELDMTEWLTLNLLHIALWVLRYLWDTLGHALTCQALVASGSADSSRSPSRSGPCCYLPLSTTRWQDESSI